MLLQRWCKGERQCRCKGAGAEVQRCTGGDTQRWCRAEVVQMFMGSRGGAEVQGVKR